MSEPPSLAYLVSQYPAFSHTFILREVRHLRARGFNIALASINPPDRPPERLTPEEREEAAATWYVKPEGLGGALLALADGLWRRPLGVLRGLAAAWGLARWDLRRLAYHHFYWIEALMLGRFMRQRGLAHVHVHFATPASTVALIAARIFPIRFSLTVHGPDELYDVPGYLLPEKVAAAHFIACIARYTMSQLMRLSPPAHWDKLHYTPLGVDSDRFQPRPEPGNTVPVILCVGRLAVAKGHGVLLRAAKRLAAEGLSFRLVLVGDGPLRAELAEQVRRDGLGQVAELVGAVDQDRIRDYYAKADIFALASFAEGKPVVLMEAMAMEIPCVSTYIAGIPELIRDGQDGLLVPAADEVALTSALHRLLLDPLLRRQLGRAGRAQVLSHYRLAANTEDFGALLERYLGSQDTGTGGPRP